MQSRAGSLIKGLEAAESGQKSKIGRSGKVWCAVALRTGHLWGKAKVQRANCQQEATSYDRLACTVKGLSRTIKTLDPFGTGPD